MTAKLTASLREAPATVPGLAAVVLFVVWAADQGGYPVTHWSPGALVMLALLALTVATVGLRLAQIPPAVRVALACLAGYTAFSYLSIAWASVPGDAWEGANRTLLYLLTFALFACWRQRGESALLLLGAWSLALVALAAFAALHIASASAAGLPALIPDGRLSYPTGYPNASAAQWLMAFWPALLLARSERVHWLLRGVLAGGAVLLASVALLSQSRGSLYATPVMLVLVFALLPGRLRTFAVLVPVAAGIALAAPSVLRVGDHLSGGQARAADVHSAVLAAFLSAFAAGAVVAAAAAFESRRGLSPALRRRLRLVVATASLLALAAVLAVGLAAAGNPVARAESAWHSFKGGYTADSSGSNRLVSGLGSNRYDFYRVALDEFVAHPVGGIGADNFQQQYLLHGRSGETPRYPHSVELRTLAETGLIGTALALAGLIAALVAVARAVRGADALARVVAAAAVAGFAYWAVHGSFDWFWEFAGLGAPAFALLGIACALAPSGARAGEGRRDGAAHAPPRRRWLLAAVPVVLVLAAALAAPWFSQLEIEEAAASWRRAPRRAYARLQDAAALDPLGGEAYDLAGSIALRYGELARADREFSRALGRTPGDSYATLERGAIASARGQRAAAIALLSRAVALAPREQLYSGALALVRAGGTIDIDELNGLILERAQQLS